MKRLLTMLVALLLALCPLLQASASLSAFDEVYANWLAAEKPVIAHLTTDIHSLMPFGEKGLGYLTAVSKHLGLDLMLSKDASAMLLTLGENELFRARESSQGGQSELTTDLLPNQTLTGGALSPMLFLTDGSPSEQAQDQPFMLIDAAEQSYDAIAALATKLEGACEEKTSKYRVKSVGTSAYSRVIKLTQEQCPEYAKLLSDLLALGMDDEHRAFLMGCTPNKGITVGLYYTEEHEPMAAYVKGSLTSGEELSYSISYQWGFLEKDGERSDNYAYTIKKKSGKADSRAITATRKLAISDSALENTAKTTITVKLNSVTEKTIANVKLQGKRSGGKTTFEGDLSTDLQVVSTGSVRTVTTIKPTLSLTDEGDYAKLTGDIKLETTRNKEPQTVVTFTLGSDTASGFSDWALSGESLQSAAEDGLTVTVLDDNGETQAPIPTQAAQTAQQGAPVAIDSLTAEERAALTLKAENQLAAKLLIAIYHLPEEDQKILTDGLTEQDATALYALLDKLN